jgi:hypothetical protein
MCLECVDLIKSFRLNGNKEILLTEKGWQNVEYLTKVNATMKVVFLALHSVAVERMTFTALCSKTGTALFFLFWQVFTRTAALSSILNRFASK